MKELLTQATHNASFLSRDLREALKKANGVQGIVLCQFIEEAANLRIKISHFYNSYISDQKGE